MDEEKIFNCLEHLKNQAIWGERSQIEKKGCRK